MCEKLFYPGIELFKSMEGAVVVQRGALACKGIFDE